VSDAASPATPLLRCEALQVGYGGRAITPAIDVSIGRGELWAIIGRNGTGKSTFFRTLLGLQPPVAGRVERAPGLPIAYVPQRSGLDPLFPLLARDVVAMGVERGLSFLKPRLAEPPAVREALARCGAEAWADLPFAALSEGQKQRVLLARALASQPTLALLDEPTSAMDEVAERETVAQLARLRDELGTTVLVVSHFLGAIRPVVDKVILFDLNCREVIVGPTEQVLNHAVFAHDYGRADDSCEVH